LESGDFRWAALLATAIICVEIVEKIGHTIFDFDILSVKTVAEKSLQVLLFRKNFKLS